MIRLAVLTAVSGYACRHSAHISKAVVLACAYFFVSILAASFDIKRSIFCLPEFTISLESLEPGGFGFVGSDCPVAKINNPNKSRKPRRLDIVTGQEMLSCFTTTQS
ncbi:hypothetical protein [Nitrosomonas sp.]|uniref:hypothetical protein n=1 Tax=Nitrosomonas sp. TaxID=42353 RepID=UPI0025E4C20E|nr:hypothetical protein [Nitrosomonas sp.]